MTSNKPSFSLADSHAHLHFESFNGRVDEVLDRANSAGVNFVLTVGIDETDSAKALELAGQYGNVLASAGLHPHEAKRGDEALDKIRELASAAAAVGECGLDYYRNLSSRQKQEVALRHQLETARRLDKPVIFHVREAFNDFFKIVDEYPGTRGIVHSFTGTQAEAEQAVSRGFMIGLNGIMTFTKDRSQLEAAKLIPLQNLVLETDCPFLSPVPFRGKENEPARITVIAEFLAGLRGEELSVLADATTGNFRRLLNI